MSKTLARLPASSLLLGLAGGSALGLSWQLATTISGALLGWLSTFLLVPLFLRPHDETPSFDSGGGEDKPFRLPLLPLYLAGCAAQAIACPWLISTVRDFGRFPLWAATLVYLLFVLTHGLQFVIAGLVARGLDRYRVSLGALLPALSWLPAELFVPTLFPWMTGHTQIALPYFAQGAALLGVPLLTFTMWWICALVWKVGIPFKRPLLRDTAPVLFLFSLIGFGWYLTEVRNQETITIPVAVVQANISIEEKRDITMIVTNEARYRQLSEPFRGGNTFIVWPETVIQRWIPEDPNPLRGRIPEFPPLANTPLMVGALSYRSEQEGFNSAFFIPASGRIPLPYHKRILMPFGEFMPFASLVPAIQQLNAGAGGLTAGTEQKVYPVVLSTPAGEEIIFNAAPLICYEDIVPSLARDAVQRGADILVNMTNDAWFGESSAPYQHHQIAAFRAIEHQRPLIRSTNTGLTAIVDQHGRTIASLPLFSEGVLTSNISVPRNASFTLYTFLGAIPLQLIALFALLLSVMGLFYGSRTT